MYNRQDVFNKYYKSDIFNLNQSDSQARRTKGVIRPNFPTLESTKEDVFNVGRERRIQRNGNRNRDEYLDEPQNRTGISLSVGKRRRNYDKIYGSDIFNQKAASAERRKGVKLIPNITNTSNCFDEMKNNDEYVNDLRYYTQTHRTKKTPFNPDLKMKTVAPEERYFRHHYEVHGRVVLPESDYDEVRKNNFIRNKRYLNNELYDNYIPYRSASEEPRREIRYTRQKRSKTDEKRPFLDLSVHPRNNARINKQIQLESYIFQNEDKNKSFDVQVKEIDDRIEEGRRRLYYQNVLGLPYRRINRETRNKNKRALGGVSRWGRTNIDWTSPDAEVMFGRTYTEGIKETYGSRAPSAYQRRLIQFADSENKDTLSGIQKPPLINFKRPEKEERINSETSRKLDDFVYNMPDLNDGQKLGIRMKTSVLDVKNDDEFNDKTRTIKEFYRNKPSLRKRREVTGKINDRREKFESEARDKGYHDFVLTYATRGNQFDKLDDYEIKNLFAKKGVQIYDIKKNPFDKGNYNTITFKVKGSDNNNQISNKINLVKDDLVKKNYKINIEKEKQKNNRKGQKNILGGARGKAIILIDPSTRQYGSRYTVMPKEVMARRGFTKAWEGLNYEYKKFKP